MADAMTGKKNGYDCPDCKHLLVTVYVDDGVAPFCKACPACGGLAISRMHDGSVDALEPEGEWYRPDDLSSLDGPTREYVERGCLLYRAKEKADG